MTKFAMPVSVLALALAASSAIAKPAVHVWPELGVETSISRPNWNIRNFEADTDKGVWIEDLQRRWYYGTFKGRCTRLEHARGIGYDTSGSSSFDKSSTIFVDDDFCQLTSFVTSEKPLSRKERKRLAKEVAMKGKASAN